MNKKNLLHITLFLLSGWMGLEAAAQEVLEEAGLTDAKYIASHEFKTKPAFAKNRYTISKRFYEADIDGDSYMITVQQLVRCGV